MVIITTDITIMDIPIYLEVTIHQITTVALLEVNLIGQTWTIRHQNHLLYFYLDFSFLTIWSAMFFIM